VPTRYINKNGWQKDYSLVEPQLNIMTTTKCISLFSLNSLLPVINNINMALIHKKCLQVYTLDVWQANRSKLFETISGYIILCLNTDQRQIKTCTTIFYLKVFDQWYFNTIGQTKYDNPFVVGFYFISDAHLPMILQI